MGLFARFKKDLAFEHNGEVIFKKDDGTKDTRYYVYTEKEKEIWVAIHPNNLKTNQIGTFHKDTMDEVLFLVEEWF